MPAAGRHPADVLADANPDTEGRRGAGGGEGSPGNPVFCGRAKRNPLPPAPLRPSGPKPRVRGDRAMAIDEKAGR